MTEVSWWLLCIAMSFGLLDTIALARRWTPLTTVTGSATLLLLLATVLTSTQRAASSRALFGAGLLCAAVAAGLGAWAGRPTANPSRHAANRAGHGPGATVAAIFAVAALCLYGLAMQQSHHLDGIGILFGLILVILTVFAFGYRAIAGAERIGGAGLATATAGQLAVIGSMAVLGIGTASLPITYGSIALAISQLLAMRSRVVHHHPLAPATAAVTSYVALASVLLGMVR